MSDKEQQKAIEILFETYHVKLCNIAFRIVSDKDIAKDIVQEVFLRLWKNKEGLDFGEQIKYYLFKATKNTALNHVEKNKKMQVWTDDMETTYNLEESPYEESMRQEVLAEKIREAVENLPPKCKKIYLLCKQEGMKYTEVADYLEVSLKTVENQMGIALKRLREDLAAHLGMYTLTLIIVLLISWLTLN